jgi:hypothetical protein
MPKEEGIQVQKIIVYTILSILKLSAFLSGLELITSKNIKGRSTANK